MIKLKKITLYFIFSLTVSGLCYSGEIEDIHLDQEERTRESLREALRNSRTYGEMRSSDHGVEVIGIERYPTFGPSAAYTLIINSDGSLRYEGLGGIGITKIGFYTGKIPAYLFNSLAHYVIELDYMSLAPEYRVAATDQAVAYTMAVIGGERKTVRNLGNGGPAALWALQQAIENMLRYIEWDDEQ